MTQVDASIPLQIQVAKPVDQVEQAGKAIALKSEMQRSELGGLQLEQAKKGIISDEKIKDIFQQPDAFSQDENGQRILSPAAIQKVFSVDPAKGMALQATHLEQVNAGLKMKHTVLQMDDMKLAKAQKMIEMDGDAALGSRDAYLSYLEDSKKNGGQGDVAGATEIAKSAYSNKLQEQVKAGIIKPEEAEAKLKDFSPAKISMIATSAKKYHETVVEERKVREDKAKAAREEQMMALRERSEDRRAGMMAAAVANRNVPDETIERNATAIKEGRMKPFEGNTLRNPAAMKTMARVMEMDPNYDAKDYGTHAKAEKDFATGKQGTAVKTFNVAISHLNTLDSLVDALHNKDTKLFNKIGNRVAEELGQTAPGDFDATKKIVTDEVTKAIIGAGGGVTDREEAAKTLSSANSPAQLKSRMNKYKDLMKGQLSGLEKQYEVSTGKKDFDKFLTDESKAVAHGGDIAAKVKDSGWTYEPSKYDYRIGPDGKAQRKAK